MEEETDFIQQLEQVRPVTRNLIESVMLDSWPDPAAIVDFGIDSQEHYEALYYPIRQHEISPKRLDQALGNGKELTQLVREAASNPHRDVAFCTSWDAILGRGVGSCDAPLEPIAESPQPEAELEIEP